MFPATKKYPRPILPLLRKRNKQRNKRHIVEKRKTSFQVSAKTLGYGDLEPLGSKLWGEACDTTGLRLENPAVTHTGILLPPSQARLVTNNRNKPHRLLYSLRVTFSFFPFFLFQLHMKVGWPPTPNRKTPTQSDNPDHTQSPNQTPHKKSDNIPLQ